MFVFVFLSSSSSSSFEWMRFGKTRNGVERDASRNAETSNSRDSFSDRDKENESADGSDPEPEPDSKKSRAHAHDPTDAACFGGAYLFLSRNGSFIGASTPNATRAPIDDACVLIRSSGNGASDPSARNASSAVSSSASDKKTDDGSVSRDASVSSVSSTYAHAAASTSLANRASATHASLAPCCPRFDSGASHFARRTSARHAAPRRLARCTFCLCQCALSSLGKTSRLAAASRLSTSRASCNAAAALPGPFGGGTARDGRRMAGRGPPREGDSENLATSDGSVASAAAALARNRTERPARAPPRRGAEGHRVARGGGTARAEDAAVADADAIS